jgi:hypothetical protein
MKKEGFRRVRRDVKQLTCVPVKLLAKCNDWKCWSKENVRCGSKYPGEFTGITNNQSWQSPHAHFISCITDSNKQTCKQTMLTEMHTDSNKCCSKCSIARENNTRHIFKTKKPLILFVCTRRTQAHINSTFPSSLSLSLSLPSPRKGNKLCGATSCDFQQQGSSYLLQQQENQTKVRKEERFTACCCSQSSQIHKQTAIFLWSKSIPIARVEAANPILPVACKTAIYVPFNALQRMEDLRHFQLYLRNAVLTAGVFSSQYKSLMMMMRCLWPSVSVFSVASSSVYMRV